MWKRPLILSKLKASGIHLSLSAVAFGVVLYLILVHWYPPPWFGIDGGWQGVRIMLFVDVVLGPFLTLIIFNPAKSRRALTFDFSLIGLTQVCAFTWGVYAVHAQRPVVIAFFEHSFHSVEERVLPKQSAKLADLKQFDTRMPALVYAKQPRGELAASSFALAFMEHLAEYEQLPLYDALDKHLDEVFADSAALQSAVAAQPDASAALAAFQHAHPQTATGELRFAQFNGRYEKAILILDARGAVLDWLPPVQLDTAKKS